MYQVLIEKQIQKQLEKIPEPNYTRIKLAIEGLSVNPRPKGYKKLQGRDGYRIRLGDYRIVYEINDRILTVFIIASGHRKDIYD